MEEQEFMADPQQLHAEAQKEPRRRVLGDYRDTIRLLREEKGFSLREIAAWFQERGLQVDHNAIWRAYAKEAGRARPSAALEQSERIERKVVRDAAMPWLEGG